MHNMIVGAACHLAKPFYDGHQVSLTLCNRARMGASRIAHPPPGIHTLAWCTRGDGVGLAYPPRPHLQILNNPSLLSVSFAKLRNVNGDWMVRGLRRTPRLPHPPSLSKDL